MALSNARTEGRRNGQVIRTAGGRRIFYDMSGDGPPLLLIMGAGESRRMWADQIPAFTPYFTVITMDNRDTGESDQESEPYTVADMAGDVVALLDALKIQRTNLIGTSMGGMIAQTVAFNAPQRVNRLILLSCSAGGDLPLPGAAT